MTGISSIGGQPVQQQDPVAEPLPSLKIEARATANVGYRLNFAVQTLAQRKLHKLPTSMEPKVIAFDPTNDIEAFFLKFWPRRAPIFPRHGCFSIRGH